MNVSLGARAEPRIRLPGTILSAAAVAALGTAAVGAGAEAAAPAQPPAGRTLADVLAAAGPTDWRALDPDHTLYLELDSGRIVIELAPQFAPEHAANILRLDQARGQLEEGMDRLPAGIHCGDPCGRHDHGPDPSPRFSPAHWDCSQPVGAGRRPGSRRPADQYLEERGDHLGASLVQG
jgi:hypothetical protein